MKSRSIAALASLALGSVFSLGTQQAMAQGTTGGNPQYVVGLPFEAALWTPANPASLACRRHLRPPHIELYEPPALA